MNEQLPIMLLNIEQEYINIISPIITHEEFIKRKYYHHHNNRSVYGHSLLVSYRSYKIAKLLNLDYKSSAIGGLLHDFYYQDWQTTKIKKKLYEAHGFVHPYEALENSKALFPNLIDKKVSNIIVRHMFPLTFIPPFYLESWIICIVDKYCSFEVFKQPKELYKYIGIKRGDKNE